MAASVTTLAKPSDETGNFFSRMPWFYQMGIMLILVLLLTYAAHVLLYSEKRAQTEKLIEQTQTLKQKNLQGSIIRQNIAEVEKALQDRRDEIDRLRDFLPEQVEISRVYDSIKDFLRGQRLELKRFAEEKSEPSEIYTRQPISVDVSGSYDSLGQFFSQLGFYKRIVSVSEVDVKQAGDPAQEAGRSIDASFRLTIFFMSQENLERMTAKKPLVPTAADKPAGTASK
ncbi:MAG: hypothetical protein DMF61_07805 [Blastocatellia bacterium AA13]|nr:MAG: hypothetical protein DMF61_07805 [Blastocatellia bacterium AA13]